MSDVNNLERLEKERRTVRAALVLVPMNSTLRELVSGLIDRYFERQQDHERRIAALEESNGKKTA